MGKIKLNQVIVSGYVPRDAYVNDKKTFLSFSVGIDDSWFNNVTNKWVNNTSWLNVKVNGKEDRISALAKKLVKGANVIVTGQMKQDTYPDKNGITVNDVHIRALSIQVLDESSGNGSSNGNYSGSANGNGNYSGNNNNAGSANGNTDFVEYIEPNMDFMDDMQFDPYRNQ